MPQVLGEVSAFLEQGLEQFQPEATPHTRGHLRILPSLCLWAAMLVCLFQGEGSLPSGI